MKYCSECGAPVSLRVPRGDHLPRHVCGQCQTVHYQNPKIIAGSIPVWDERILLCRRAIEPRYGLWTLPAGFMENGETTVEAAAREAREEANAELENLALYGVFNLPHISQVYMMFRAELKNGSASAGSESLDVALFREDEIPWDELAFPVVRETLELFLAERRDGRFGVHMGDVLRTPERKIVVRRHQAG
jgi:ADP-ribose pyrophosphatase YjhB (NUDIX family)